MIYEGLRIKTPNEQYLKTLTSFKNEVYTSFLYNYSTKNETTGKYEIKERYIINVYNIVPNPDSEIICTRIVNCKPAENKSKDGRTFLNCIVTIEADNVKEPKLPAYANNTHAVRNDIPQSVQYQQQTRVLDVTEDDLPF